MWSNPVVSVLGVTDRVRLSLGYEHYNAHLRCPGSSLGVELAWTDGQAEVALGPQCLRRSGLSCAVSFTDPFTNAVFDRAVLHQTIAVHVRQVRSRCLRCYPEMTCLPAG